MVSVSLLRAYNRVERIERGGDSCIYYRWGYMVGEPLLR